jgi:glycosyltransferase involved in cell wall biosynthesis/lipopolysaccharide biosynthesis protein
MSSRYCLQPRRILHFIPSPKKMSLEPKPSRTAIIVHVYHMDIWQHLARKLQILKGQYDLYLTMNQDVANQYGQAIRRSFPSANVHICPSVGLDILPFLTVLLHLITQNYQQVLKLHTKKGETDFGQTWGEVLFEALIGYPGAISQAEETFEMHSDLSLLGPAPFFLSGQKLMLANQPLLEQVSQTLIGQSLPRKDWGFFAGSMFWVRPQVFISLAQWAVTQTKMFETNYAPDGQLPHALERAFSLLPQMRNQSLGFLHASATGQLPVVQVPKSRQMIINLAGSRTLIQQYRTLDANTQVFEGASLLDIEGYQNNLYHKGWDRQLIQSIDPITHYLLIGQFSGARHHSIAWTMRNRNIDIRWKLLENKTRRAGFVSIVMPVFNQLALTMQAVAAVATHTPASRYELVLVDNGSDKVTRQGLMKLEKQYADVQVLRLDKNLFFALGSNLGFAQGQGEYTVFLNNDTQVRAGWLSPLIAALQQPDLYAAQPLLLYPDGTVQCMGVVFSAISSLGYPIYRGMSPEKCNAPKPRKFQAISAACMAIHSNLFAQMQGFDPIFINGQEDIDLCMRLHKKTGKAAAYVPESCVIHHESKTPGRRQYIEQNKRVFLERWKDEVATDNEGCYQYDRLDIFDRTTEKDSSANVASGVARLSATIGSERRVLNRNLKNANELFRQRKFKEALQIYHNLAAESEEMKRLVEFNVRLCELRLGKPAGSSIEKIESKTKNITTIKEYPANNIGVIQHEKLTDSVILLHIFSIDIAKEIISKLSERRIFIDILATCASSIVNDVKHLLRKTKNSFSVMPLENIGYDIYPFLEILALAQSKGYNYFCKVHTKRDHPNVLIEDAWRNSLLDGVLPNAELVSDIIREFRVGKIKLAGSALNFISYEYSKYENEGLLKDLMSQLKLDRMALPDFGFFAGTMFWGRVSDYDSVSSKQFVDVLLKREKNKTQKKGRSSSYWHATERLLGLIAANNEGRVGLIDYDISEKYAKPVLHIKSINSFLKLSAKLRYQAFEYKNIYKKYVLLQKSGLVDAGWCYKAYNEKDNQFYDCYLKYLTGQIPHLSEKHKKGEVQFDFQGGQLSVRSENKTKEYQLSSPYQTENITIKDVLDVRPSLSSAEDDIVVSIICVTYLHEKFLVQAIESMVGQETDFKYEILISDDCSPDNSSRIIDRYVRKHTDKMRYIKRSNNVGVKENIFDLISKARGKYIAINEGDDYWTDVNKLQVQVNYLESHPDCAICYHQVAVIDEESPGQIDFFPGEYKAIFTAEELVERNLIQTNSVVYRKNEYSLRKLPDERMLPGDWYRHLLNSLSGEIHLLPYCMSVYRKHAGGMWSSAKNLHEKYGINEIVFFKEVDHFLRKIRHDVLFAHRYRYFEIVFWHIYEKINESKLFELVSIDTSLSNYFFHMHGMNIEIDHNTTEDEFIGKLRSCITVDVLVTSYNHCRYIKQALESVINQQGIFTLKVYVADDCSTDNTGKIVDEYSTILSETVVNISPSKNLGMLANMKRAFGYLSAKFVAICEGDDYWLSPHKLLKQVIFLSKNKAASMCFNWLLLEFVDNNYSVPHPGQSAISTPFIDFRHILKTAVTANFSCCMYRIETIKNVPKIYFDQPSAADWLFNLYAANQGKVGFLKDILSVYRVHERGVWSGLTQKQQQERRNNAYSTFYRLFPKQRGVIEPLIVKVQNYFDVNRLSHVDEGLIMSRSIKFNIDQYTTIYGRVKVRGWAFLNYSLQDAVKTRKYMFIVGKNNQIIDRHECLEMRREDVEKAHKNSNAIWSGFEIVFKPDFDEGHYRLVLCLATEQSYELCSLGLSFDYAVSSIRINKK